MAQPLTSPEAAPAARPRRSVARRILKILLVLLIVLAVAAGAGGLWLRSRLNASLPLLDGERALAGLSAPVEVERDDLGVPTIKAANQSDAARALGFVHAQDRFFQMDLLRRQAAGELAEIIGQAALEVDREHRVHRFRHRARQMVAAASAEERTVLQAYAEGVNAGVAALEEKPFEYLALRTDPAPWRPEDSVLAILAMFIELHDEDGSNDADLGYLRDTLPPAMFAFLAPQGTEWDAPVVGEAMATPPIPGPEVFDLRRRPAPALPKAASVRRPSLEEDWAGEMAAGSNNWAVAGSHTADGKALLADDMHLGISVPNTWYRASLVWPDGAGGEHRMTGVTLPGTPAVAVGSNGHVAWGFTNSYGDWTDIVTLEADPKSSETYQTPRGPRRFTRVKEELRAKGAESQTMEVVETIWGPVIGADHAGRPQVLAWTAYHPEAVNLVGMVGMEQARTIEDAMAVANRSGIPPQNFVVADSSGRIGWTIMGRIPRRPAGFDGRLPGSWADGSRGWNGWLAPEEAPRIVDPPSGRIWTANARVVDGEMLAKLGDGGYALGARARQIRDDLAKLEKATPQDMLAVQLDDRAVFLEPWRALLLRTLSEEAVKGHPDRAELRRLVETTWTGRASVDSAGYRMVRAYRNFVMEAVFDSLLGQAEKPPEERVRPTFQFEGPLWKIVNERPAHLLDPRYKTWNELLLASADDMTAYLKERGPNLADRTWGERNTTRIGHPLSRAVPFLGRWLDVPARRLPGDEDMPRVQGPGFGASERLVVSPGNEAAGFFHMPVGQSGHPRSPYYTKGHDAWEEGRPTPFLPGQAAHRLRLTPGR